ncbi:antitoxin [Streptomyces sp. PSKA54]|uniref:Antitoxin n=1 Tax=Streptomyces himalayensis subsp. aureolus TaxID=2758039 RepID=A0A7W2D5Z0_9ACTN|nr:antitoxin [Streptomyces himalayensis]MBA4865373.1 antitoxin [Streptomyces himalayensis subsp. aureolus]
MGIFDRFKGQGRHRAGHASEATAHESDERTGGRPYGGREDKPDTIQQQLNERLTDREHESDRPQP